MTNRQAAIKVIQRLQRNGFEALLAGGCVRDMLLRRRAKDHDVATNAEPNDVIRLFRRTLKVGAKFGVVIVLIEKPGPRGQQVEVATFRTESDYGDGRHPGSVRFSNAAEDASRRDFTINGMFYDPLGKRVIDYVDGQTDLKRRIIRTIGSPAERFGEDYLRMLRAVRFSAQLGFAIDPATWSAIAVNAKKIANISGERIAIELEGILTCPNRAEGASMFFESGLADAIFPGLTDEQAKSAVEVLRRLRKKVDFALALACLFAGCDTKFALRSCEVLKLSRNQNKHIHFLLVNRSRLLYEQMSLASLKKILVDPYFSDLYEFEKALRKAEGDKKGHAILIALRKRIKALGNVELKPKPLLDGHDLMRLGAVPDPALGQLAEEMYIAQLEGILQTKEQAEHWVLKWLHKHANQQ